MSRSKTSKLLCNLPLKEDALETPDFNAQQYMETLGSRMKAVLFVVSPSTLCLKLSFLGAESIRFIDSHFKPSQG
ncbi:hypothetical protein M0R45_018822 [Rubus argutus]|uniref:Uncharacterized protein n=1 Tax=Rubus argutus TaxID=59490 RepID=A0AAW1X5H3_RUBAR